jgi:predicted dehydrogenase
MQTKRTDRRVVVVGTEFGERGHVPALRAADFEVGAIVGRDLDKTAATATRCAIPRHYVDLEHALDDVKPDVVAITTPSETHLQLVRTVLDHGAHVVCEKPFAPDVATARAMVDLAGATDRICLVAHQWRFAPERALIRRAVLDGLIGVPRMFTAVDVMPLGVRGVASKQPWFFWQRAGGGWVQSAGSHWIDHLHTWFGPIATVAAQYTMIEGFPSDVEDGFTVQVRHDSGVSGVVQQTPTAWGYQPFVIAVYGSGGTAWIADGAAHVADRTGTRTLPVPPELALPEMATNRSPVGRDHVRPMVRFYEALAARLEGRDEGSVPLPTFADGLAILEVVSAMRASATSGGERVALRA